MIVDVTVDAEFLAHREWALNTYKPGKKSKKQHAMSIDCELYEHHMMTHEGGSATDTWAVDYISKTGSCIDVKCLFDKWFNIAPQKMVNILHQRDFINEYEFIEHVNMPERPVELGDVVQIRRLGLLSYDALAKIIRPSGYQFRGSSHYADVRKIIK